MRMNRAKKSVEVLNKVNGGRYKITDVTNGVATAECLEDTFGTDTVWITESNALCFRVVYDPNPREIPMDISMDDSGILIRKGSPVTNQGSIKVKRILWRFPGKLLLAVKSKDGGSEEIDLMAYDADRDRFEKLIYNSIPDSVTVIPFDGFIGLKYTRMKEKTDENGKSYQAFDHDGIILVDQGKFVCLWTFEYPIGFYVLNAGQYSVFQSNQKVEENGMLIDVEPYTVVIRANYTPVTVDNWSEPIKIDRYKAIYSGDRYPINEVMAAKSFCIAGGGIILKSKDTLLVLQRDSNPVSIKDRSTLEQLKGYDYLIDIEKDNCKFTFSLASEEYQIRALHGELTSDRGWVYTVQ